MNDGAIYSYLSWILAVQTNKMYFSNLHSMRGHNHPPPILFNLKKRIQPNGYQIVWLPWGGGFSHLGIFIIDTIFINTVE